MTTIYEFDKLYIEKRYFEFIQKFLEYVQEGNAIDNYLINKYVIVLTNLHKFDEAYNIINFLSKDVKEYHTEDITARLLFYCYKSFEAESMLLSKENLNIYDYILLCQIYLREGKIQEAKDLIEKLITNQTDYKIIEKLRKLFKQIFNYEKSGAFIEIEYSEFIKRENELQPGHIITLKDLDKLYLFSNSSIRTNMGHFYLVLDIQDDILYLSPVTTKLERKGHILFQKDYPNSIGNRYVKSILNYTPIDNVLSVKDKLSDKDLQGVMTSQRYSIYLKDFYEILDKKQEELTKTLN